ncbi:hypothetical protein BST61_g8660 [Cercospora zeina]
MYGTDRETGKRRSTIEVALRNCKRVHHLQRRAIYMFLLEDLERLELCPVAQILALAIADGALEDIRTPADIKTLAAPAAGVTKRVRIRDDVKQKPLLRPMMEALGYRAGHRERFTPYSIRRGHGGLLDATVSAAVRQKRM